VGDVFVTGGSGFVGGAMIRRLVAERRFVKALARSEAAAETVRSLGAQPVPGDLDDPQALLEGMRGVRTVFHVAGVNAMCVRDPRPMLHANVEGSAAVIRAAAAAKVTRVVHTSSAATIGEPAGTVGREDTPHRGSFLSNYERSKLLSERRVLSLGEELGVEVVCVNPSSVQGPGRVGGSSRLLLDLVNGRLPVVVDTFVSIVDIDDCTEAHLLAEFHGAPGERYLINGASIRIGEAVDLLRRVCGEPRRVRFVPRSLASGVGTMAGGVAGMFKRDPSICPEMVRTLLHGHRYDGSLAQRALDLRYTPLEITVRRTLAWYAERGLAPGPRPPSPDPVTGA
jgi:dihydroflavonol-4-reductase